MSDVAPVVRMFQTRIREELPEFAAVTDTATPDGFGNFKLLDIPCPSNPSRLGVLYCGDCFEISFSVAETRGPAEKQIIITSDLSSAVTATIDFLQGIITGHILVDVIRYRLFWFQPYYLAFFREASRRPKGHIIQTLRWNDKNKGVG
jgi:hypothetical protein